MQHRQPIVAILGHVDHGKTTLLDYIRKTHRVSSEAGGITQSIGAYQAEYQGQKITFIDTPGHAAFSSMRSRGAQVADLAVLIVAADDGVKPQTLESIKHIKTAGIPFLVALNKIDKPGVILDKAKAELTQAEVFVEGYGGNTPLVPLSGKTGEGVNKLLESILLLAELEDLPYLPADELVAPVIEAQKDERLGISVSVIVRSGTLLVGSIIYTATATGKVRALYNELNQPVKALLPGQPGKVVGLKNLPAVGETVTATPASSLVPTGPVEPSDQLGEILTPKLNLILRADTIGSLEAIKSSLSTEINVVLSGTGDVSESDVLLARSTGSLILGFAVRVSASTLKLAELDGVVVKTYPIIYELLEYLEKKVMKLLEPTIDEEELGQATILKIFEINRDRIAGCRVDSGVLTVGDTVHVKTESAVKEARIRGMRIGKNEVKHAESGVECGILFSTNLDISPKDLIISYKKIKTDEE